MRPLLLTVAMAVPLAAAYSYFFTGNFQTSGLPTATWQLNGSITTTAGEGLVSTAANGGSVIYQPAIPDGTAEYELKATLKIAASGGTFTPTRGRVTTRGPARRRRDLTMRWS